MCARVWNEEKGKARRKGTRGVTRDPKKKEAKGWRRYNIARDLGLSYVAAAAAAAG